MDSTTLGAAIALIKKTKADLVDEFGNSKIFYGGCDTAAGTAAKASTIDGFTGKDLENGVVVYITFDNTNSAANPTLNISDTGAKPIKCVIRNELTGLPEANYLIAGQTYRFVYDGENWVTVFGGFVRVTDDGDGNVTIS